MSILTLRDDALVKLAGGVEPNPIAILSNINRPKVDWLDLLGEVTDATLR